VLLTSEDVKVVLMKELQRTGVLLCEANGHSDTTEIPRLLWNPEIYWPVRWSPPSPIACV